MLKDGADSHDVVKMKPTTFKYKKRNAGNAISQKGEHSQTRSSLDNSISQKSDLSTENLKKDSVGKASRELDTEYLEAVTRGDMETAQKWPCAV